MAEPGIKFKQVTTYPGQVKIKSGSVEFIEHWPVREPGKFFALNISAGVLQFPWGAVAQWLEQATDNRVVAGSYPTEAAWKLWQFPLPRLSEETLIWCLSARGSKRSHTGGKCVTCRGLHILPGQ